MHGYQQGDGRPDGSRRRDLRVHHVQSGISRHKSGECDFGRVSSEQDIHRSDYLGQRVRWSWRTGGYIYVRSTKPGSVDRNVASALRRLTLDSLGFGHRDVGGTSYQNGALSLAGTIDGEDSRRRELHGSGQR